MGAAGEFSASEVDPEAFGDAALDESVGGEGRFARVYKISLGGVCMHSPTN